MTGDNINHKQININYNINKNNNSNTNSIILVRYIRVGTYGSNLLIFLSVQYTVQNKKNFFNLFKKIKQNIVIHISFMNTRFFTMFRYYKQC